MSSAGRLSHYLERSDEFSLRERAGFGLLVKSGVSVVERAEHVTTERTEFEDLLVLFCDGVEVVGGKMQKRERWKWKM